MAKSFFKTQFQKHKRVPSATGNGYMLEYGFKYDDKGIRTLVPTGKTDVHARIQVDKDSCDINLIMQRFSQGDVEALNKIKGVYMDATDMPTSYPEMLQRINDCNVAFDRLPIEVKEAFNNDSNYFWSTFGTKEFEEIYGKFMEKAMHDHREMFDFDDDVVKGEE